MAGVFNRSRGGFDPNNAVLIGRPSPWGNPFVVGVHGTRVEVIARYEQWVRNQPAMVAAIKQQLRGRDLVCYCKPAPCHGDVLYQIANEE